MNTVTMACFRIRIDRLSNARTNGRRKIERKVEADSLLETLLSVKLSHKSKNLQAIGIEILHPVNLVATS